MVPELHGGTLAFGVLFIAPLLAVGNLVVWWQTRGKAMLWWAAGSLTVATAAPQVQPAEVALGYVSIALALCFYWEGIRSFQRRSAVEHPLAGLSGLGLLGVVALGAASDWREAALSLTIAGISAVCAYCLLVRHRGRARESSCFVGGLFCLNALFFPVLGGLVAAEGRAGISAEALHMIAYAELLVLLIGWNFGFVMMAMQHYLEMAADLATHDDLTGVLNRRAFGDKVRHHINLARRGGATLSILAMDLDHFKQVNDTYGHPAGDEVLRAFVRLAQSCLREADQLGRVGGEEFVALLPATSAAGAQTVAERLRSTLAGTPIPYRGGSINITVSIGLAEFDRHLHDLDSFLEAADTALYAAKRRGRNRIELAPHQPSVSPKVQLIWDGRYASGHLKIDSEHECLFRMVNELIRKAQDHTDIQSLHNQLKEMLFWLGEHFRNEEAVFLPVNWDGAEEHIRRHRMLESRGQELLDGIAEGRHDYGDLLDFLIREVVGIHLAKEDAGYFAAIGAGFNPPGFPG